MTAKWRSKQRLCNVDAALKMLGITQAQYNKIIERWADPEMMDVPAPFVYGADNTYFRHGQLAV